VVPPPTDYQLNLREHARAPAFAVPWRAAQVRRVRVPENDDEIVPASSVFTVVLPAYA
jgi:hypothetical protein